MRKIVIMRFGLPIPVPEISAALAPHIATRETAIAMPMPGGVMSIFDTESTDEQIAAALVAVGAFFVICPFNRNALNFPPQQLAFVDKICGTTGTSTESPAPTVELTMDDVLQKLHDHGMESLSEAEKAILEGGA